MNKISARKVMSVDPDQLWNKRLTGNAITVVFDDGDVVMSYKEIIYSNYFWEYHRIFPDLPLTKNQCLKAFYVMGTESTHRDMIDTVIWTTLEWLIASGDLSRIQRVCPKITSTVNMDRSELLYALVRHMLIATNRLYNASVNHHVEYTLGVDISDFVELSLHQEFMLLRAKAHDKGNRPSDIAEINAEATEILRTTPIYKADGSQNMLSWFCMRGLVKISQTLQCTFVRGYVPDIDLSMIPHCIETNLTEGLRSYRDSSVLAREASIAAISAKDALPTISYTGRRQRLVSESIRKVEWVDCGSKHLIFRRLEKEDIASMVGKYYVDPDTEKLKMVLPDSYDIVGKLIGFRSVINCDLPNRHNVCHICYGGLAESKPPMDGAGITHSSKHNSREQQGSLSVKHEMGTQFSKISSDISDKDKQFIRKKGNACLLANIPRAKRIRLVLSNDEAWNILDIFNVDDTRSLAPGRVTRVSNLRISVDRANGVIDHNAELGDRKNPAMFSYELLAFLKEDRTRVVNKAGVYWFDVTDFPKTKAICVIPHKLSSYLQQSNAISKLLERTTSANGSAPNNEHDIVGTLSELTQAIRSHSNVNQVVIETMLAAYISKKDNPMLPMARAWEKDAIHIGGELALKRTFGTVGCYRNQALFLTDPANYLVDNRVDSPMDVFVDPDGVVKAYREGKLM